MNRTLRPGAKFTQVEFFPIYQIYLVSSILDSLAQWHGSRLARLFQDE